MISVKDKIVFITGASSGIGESCGKIFAQSGAQLILAARRQEKLEKLAEELTEKFTTKVYLLKLDVRDRLAVESAINSLPEPWKDIDILINNAGLSRGLNKLHIGDFKDWEEMIDTNIKGLLYMTRYIVPEMVSRGRGHVVNIGSIAGRGAYPGGNLVFFCVTRSPHVNISELLVVPRDQANATMVHRHNTIKIGEEN